MRERLPLFAGVGLFVFAILSMSLFTVDQRQHALVLFQRTNEVGGTMCQDLGLAASWWCNDHQIVGVGGRGV